MQRPRLDLLFSALIVLLLLWVVWEARDWPFRTRLFPWMLGIPVLGLALLQLGVAAWHSGVARRAGSVAPPPAAPLAAPPSAPAPVWPPMAAAMAAPVEPPAASDPRQARARALGIIAWMLVFFAAIWLFGFRWGASAATVVFLRFYAREAWSTSLALGLGMYLFFLVVLEAGLSVPLPAGLIPQALGIGALDVAPVATLLRGLLGR
jgi:hypothetical protein